MPAVDVPIPFYVHQIFLVAASIGQLGSQSSAVPPGLTNKSLFKIQIGFFSLDITLMCFLALSVAAAV